MGYFYMMAVECDNKWKASAIAERYDGLYFPFIKREHNLTDDLACRLSVSVDDKEKEGCVQVVFWPSNVTGSGIADEDEAYRATQISHIMYGLLKNEQHFDAAICGVECYGGSRLEDLIEGWKDLPDYQQGLVISNQLWEKYNRPNQFVWFNDSHVWVPFKKVVFK